MVVVLGSHLSKQPASLAPNSTKALQSASVEQPPLYKGQLELVPFCVAGTVRTVLLKRFSLPFEEGPPWLHLPSLCHANS